jgi:hypothetical protein
VLVVDRPSASWSEPIESSATVVVMPLIPAEVIVRTVE